MAKVVVLVAGISGHTAAAHIRRKLEHKHEVVVVSPSKYYQWIPLKHMGGSRSDDNRPGAV
jgi:sulfide:quinone oxidoreductase